MQYSVETHQQLEKFVCMHRLWTILALPVAVQAHTGTWLLRSHTVAGREQQARHVVARCHSSCWKNLLNQIDNERLQLPTLYGILAFPEG